MTIFNFEDNEFYYEIEGQGPPLVLAHPYMSSTTHWHKSGWVDILNKNNTLIMFDYTGHGKTSCPNKIENYYISYVSEVIIKILIKFDLSPIRNETKIKKIKKKIK